MRADTLLTGAETSRITICSSTPQLQGCRTPDPTMDGGFRSPQVQLFHPVCDVFSDMQRLPAQPGCLPRCQRLDEKIRGCRPARKERIARSEPLPGHNIQQTCVVNESTSKLSKVFVIGAMVFVPASFKAV